MNKLLSKITAHVLSKERKNPKSIVDLLKGYCERNKHMSAKDLTWEEPILLGYTRARFQIVGLENPEVENHM